MTTDAKILSALRENADGVSGAELAEQLKISRTAVWARIEELRRVGYDIEAGRILAIASSVRRTRCTRTICSRDSAKQKSSDETSACLNRQLRRMT